MNKELVRINADSGLTDLKSVPEACEGLTTAVVSFYVTTDGRLGRMVTVFDTADMPFDHVPMGHARIMDSLGNIRCFRPMLYRLEGVKMEKSGIAWPTVVKEP